MTKPNRICFPGRLGSSLVSADVQDGKVYLPIPISLFQKAGVRIDLPVSCAPLDVGGIYIFNPSVQNPERIMSIIKPR